MRLRTKITLFFFVIAVLGSIVGGAMNYSNFEEVLTDEIYNHLETTTQTRTDHVLNFLDEKKIEIEMVATHQELSNEELKEIMDIDERIYELFILDSNGKIITGSDESQIGKDKSGDDYFINSKNQTYIKDAYYSETIKKKLFTISTPHVGGVLVARIGLEELETITADKLGLGETGEVYIVNSDKFLISSSRFFENNIMVQEVHSLNSRTCFWDMDKYYDASTGKVEVPERERKIFLDYRGENVFGLHGFVPQMNWCVLVEIDIDEALIKPMKKFVVFSFIISAGIILFFTLVGFVLGKKLEKKCQGGRK